MPVPEYGSISSGIWNEFRDPCESTNNAEQMNARIPCDRPRCDGALPLLLPFKAIEFRFSEALQGAHVPNFP